MPDERLILLVSPDLLSTSRIAGLAQPLPARVETLRRIEDPLPGGPYDLVLVDLQTVPGTAAEIVSRALMLCEGSGEERARLVAFGPHVAKERLAEALAAGADAVVSRGELLGDFATLVQRWTE